MWLSLATRTSCHVYCSITTWIFWIHSSSFGPFLSRTQFGDITVRGVKVVLGKLKVCVELMLADYMS